MRGTDIVAVNLDEAEAVAALLREANHFEGLVLMNQSTYERVVKFVDQVLR